VPEPSSLIEETKEVKVEVDINDGPPSKAEEIYLQVNGVKSPQNEHLSNEPS